MFSKPALSEGYWDNVLVSNVDGADDFTVKLAGSENEFVQMMIDLQSECRKTTPLIKHAVGDFIMARFIDEQWYRAVITGMNSDGTISVRYIDYGNFSNIAKQDTRPFSQKSLSLPEQGVRCRLNRIDFSKLPKLTSDQANQSFKQAAESQQVIAQFVTQVSDRWNVELIHPMGSINQWYGTEYSCLLTGATPTRPANLPHPNNAGLESLSNSVQQSTLNGSTSTDNVIEKFAAQVVYSNSPIEFWFQKHSDQEDITNLCEIMATSVADPSYTSTVGCLCAAMYSEDETWYRAQVLDLPPPNNATVYFVDYGNTETINRSQLAPLSPGAESQPHYAYIASLTGLQPFAGAWPKHASDRFADLAMADVCTIGILRTDGTKLTVKLTVTGQDVAQMLIAEGLAGPSTPAPVEVIEHPLNISAHRATPPRTTQTTTRLANQPSPSVTTNRYPIMPVEPNKSLKVYASWLINPDQFWVQKAGCEPVLEQLLADAAQCASTSASLPSVRVGCTCIAKYSADGQWYRGEIQTVNSNGTCTVLFVDYGNSEKIINSDICTASPELLEIPTQSVKCSLIGIKATSGDGWSTESHDIMESLLAEGGMCCFLAKNKDCYLVDITHGDSNKSLSESLISSNVALSNKTGSQASAGSHGSKGSRGGMPKSGTHKSPPLPNSREVTTPASNNSIQPASSGDHQPPAALNHAIATASNGGPHGDTAVVPAVRKSTAPPPKIPDCTHVDLGLSVGSRFIATVVHIETMKHFYVLCDKTRAAMDDMYEIMNRFYHRGTLMIVSSPQIGGIYVVKFSEDQQWYRCKVVKEIDGGKVEVFYIDYGNNEVTDCINLRVINPEFACLPAQALLCNLSQSPDTVSSSDQDDFKQKVLLEDIPAEVVGMIDGKIDLNLIKDGQTLGAQYKPHFIKTYLDDDTPTEEFCAFLVYEESQTEFYLQKSEDSDLLETTMNEVVAISQTGPQIKGPVPGQACIAKFADDGLWYRAEVISVSGENCKVHFVDYGNSAMVSLTELIDIDEKLKSTPKLAVLCSLLLPNNENMMEYACDGVSELTVTVHKAEAVNNDKKLLVTLRNNQGQEFGGAETTTTTTTAAAAAAQPTTEIPASAAQPTTAQSVDADLPTASAFPPLNLSSLGSQIVGYLVYEEDDKFYIQKTEDTDIIETTSEQVQTAAAQHPDDTLKSPVVGGACIAKFSDDGLWYRAEICSVDEAAGSCQVYFIDYGNSAIVSTTEMLNIESHLADVRRLAYPCQMSEHTELSLTEFAGDSELIASISDIRSDTLLIDNLTNTAKNETLTCKQPTPERVQSSMNQLLIKNSSSSGPTTPIRPPEFVFPKKLVPTETVLRGYLSHVESADELYIQLEQDKGLLTQITVDIQVAGKSSEPAVYCPVDQACMAVFSSDHSWYRSKVTSVMDGANQSTIQFIDFGNSETVRNSQLKVLPVNLRSAAPVAIRCRANDDEMKSLTTNDINEKYFGNPLDVTFTGTAEPYSVNIALGDEEAVPSGGAVEPEPIPVEPQANTDVVQDSELREPVIPEITICDLSYRVLTDLEEGSDVPVVVTHVETPDKFYSQLVEHSKDMDEVTALLYQNYVENDGYKSLLLKSQYHIKGQDCVARFSDDEQFYRAVITDEPQNDLIPVRFIDFGNSESVSPDVLCVPHSSLLKYSCQAVQFSLHNTYPNNGETWDSDSISRLNELVSADQVTAKLLKVLGSCRDQSYIVSLNTTDGNVSDNLTDGGFSCSLPKSAVSHEEFCNDVLSSMQEKLQDKFGSASVITKLDMLIKSLKESLDTQLASMTETVGRSSTAQEYVRFVLMNMMNEITEVEPESSNDLTVTNKNQMQIEVNNVVAVLLEKVLEYNDEVATQLANQHEDEPNATNEPGQEE